jgi:hypothetical protein
MTKPFMLPWISAPARSATIITDIQFNKMGYFHTTEANVFVCFGCAYLLE